MSYRMSIILFKCVTFLVFWMGNITKYKRFRKRLLFILLCPEWRQYIGYITPVFMSLPPVGIILRLASLMSMSWISLPRNTLVTPVSCQCALGCVISTNRTRSFTLRFHFFNSHFFLSCESIASKNG